MTTPNRRRMRHPLAAAVLAALGFACASDPPGGSGPPGAGGSGMNPVAGAGGSGAGGAGGVPSGGSGGGAGPGGAGGGGGSAIDAGAGRGGSPGGSGGSVDAGSDAAAGRGGGAPDAAASDLPAPRADAPASMDRVSPADATAPTSPSGQGPIAEGRIVFSQDFEQGMDGMGRSPRDLPADRVTVVDDPLGRRGKVMKVTWLAGDNFRTSPNTLPRSWVSTRSAHETPLGETVSYAFGYMTTSSYIGATFAQSIRPGGPIWMLQGRDQGQIQMVFGGIHNLEMRLQPNVWYDFRLEFRYGASGSGGGVILHINGVKVFERLNGGFGDPAGTKSHWDGGIYLTGFGAMSNMTRTVYFSNMSIGVK